MATLRDLGLDVSTDNGRANLLHEQDLAAGMGSLRRGWETDRIGNELNPLRTQALDAEIVNDTARSQALRAQIGALEQRQQRYAPEVNRVEDIHGVGDALSYGAAQVGQGAASMIDPMAVSAGLATAGRVASAIPHPIAKGLGYAAQGAAVGIPYFMSKNQLQGEFIGEAERDPELLARTSKQGLRDMAGNYGMLAAIPDSAFPGLVGRQISGLTRAGGTIARKAALGPAATTAAGLLVEGGTETLQNMGSQYARGILNPNRDTSGDFMDNVNSLVGGAVGAGPFAAAGAYAEAGHNRLDAGVDAVKEKAGEVVDMMNESPTVQKAVEQGKKWYQFGKGKAGDVVDLAQQKATDFATGEDGSVSMGNAADKVKDAYNEAASHVISRADEKALASSMDNMDPEAVKAMTPEAASAVLAKDDARRRDVATRLLSARTDETSKQLLEAMQDPQNFDALDDAVDHLRQTSGAASLSQVAGEMTSAMASYAGSTLGSAAKGVGDIAVKFGKGVMQGMRKKNMQSELDLNSMETSDPASPYDNWLLRTTRNKTTLGDEALAQIHTRKGTMAEQAKEDSYRRAVMAGEHLANKAKQIPSAKPEIVDYMRTVAYEINDLADSWGMGYMDKPSDEAMQRQKSGMSFNLDRIAEDLNNMFGKMAGDALTRLERDADPKSAPMFEFLREKVLQGENEAGRAARQEAREAAISQMLRLLPRKLFNQTLPEGGAEKAFRGFEMLARNRAVKGLREHLVAQLGQDTLNKIMQLVSGTAVEGKPEQQMSEPVSEYDQAAAQKKMDKGGSAIYQFRGTLAPRSGGDIFARTTKDAGKSDTDSVIDGEDITRRPQLFKGTTDPKTGSVTGNELMPSGDNMLDFKIKEMEDRVGYKRGETGPGEDPGWNDTHKGYGVDTVPAWDLMKDMTPGRILSLYRDYLRQDSAPGKDKTPTAEQTEAGRKATAVGMLLGRLVSNQQKPAGDPSQWTERQTQEWKKALVLAKETGHKGEGPVFESMDALNDHQSQVTLKEAEAYFRDHHIVRAYSMTDNNPLELGKPEAMEMQKKGKKIEDSIRRDADRAEDAETADQIRSDANLLFFPKDGKDVPIAVRDLVLWAKKSSDYAGQTQADDEVSHAPGKENNRYLTALVEAISAYATAHADGMPYKINPGGEQEFFKQSRKGMIDGIPDSLMLQNKSYAESAAAGELDAKFKSPLGIKRSVAAEGPNRGRDPADIRDRASNQRAVRKDQSKQEDFFTADPLESVAAQPGGVYVPTSQNEREAAEKLADKLYKENPDTWMDEYKRLAPYPSSSTQFYQPNIDVGTESTTKSADGKDVTRTGRFPANRSGKASHEAKTEDSGKTELDFSNGQDPKAEADEITNQKWFTQQTMEKYQAPTTASRGMSSAKHNAAGVLRTMMDDPRAGDREAITLLRTALMPLDGAEAKGRSYEAYRVAPLIHLVSTNRESDGAEFRALTNAQYFENAGATPGLINIIRRGAAQVLMTKSNMSDANRLTLARQLTGDTALQHKGLIPALEAFLKKQGGDVTREDMAVNWGDPSTFPKTEALKVQPALTTTAKQEVAAKPAAPAPTTASAQAEFDSVLADMDKDPTFAFKGAVKPYAESAAGQAAIDRVRAVPDAAEQARRARNAAAKTAAVDPKVAELQAQLDAAIASLQKTTTAATGVAPTKPVAAPKVATPPPEGYVVKAPSADLQSKIDAALPKMDGTYLSAIKAAITRNEMWAASGDAGPNVAKVDIPNLKKWAAMSEAEAKAAAEANNSPNMGRIVKALQAGSTGGPAGKPGGAPAGVKLTGGAYVAKDNVKSEQATKFIGRGSETSSTASYAKQWGARANSGSYTSSDRVFISAEGKRVGRLDPDAAEIGKATAAGATILTDSMTTGRERDYNVGERQVVEILAKNGYTESAPGVWTPTRKRNNQAGGDASIRKLLADAASALDTRTESLRLLNSLSPEDQHTLQNDMLSNKGMSSLLPARMQEGFREWVRDYGKGESAFAWENLHENEVEYLEDILDQREYNDAIDVLMATAILGKNKLNAQTPDGEQPGGTKRNNMVAPVSAELADTRTIMRQLGFKSAPVQFADVAAKLLSDPDQDLAAFVKDSAVGLSHLITAEENFKEIRAALQSDAWLAVRAKIIARLVKGGMMRGDAMVESYRILTEQALTGELIARTKAEKNALAALWQMVRDFVSKFKEVTGSAEFADLVRNKLNELVDKSKGPIDLKKGFAKVTFQQAVDGDPVSAAVLAHVSTNPNIAITGSIVLADKGSIYRKADNMLHDLDLIVTGSKEAAEAHLRKAFPDAKQVYAFQTSNGKVDTFIVPPKGATVENVVKQYGEKGRGMSFEIVKDGKVIGRTWNDADGEHKSGTAGTLVDFFTGTEELPSSTIPFTVGGKQHSMKAMAPGSIFDAKLSMHRDKDITDYLNYVPTLGRKLNAQSPDSSYAEATEAEIAEAKAWLEKVAPGTIFKIIKDAGYSGEFIEATNTVEVAINAAAGIKGTTYHEGLHKFFAQFVRSNPKLQKMFEGFANDPRILNRLKELLQDYPAAQAQLVDGEERLAYAFQFWKAGLLRVDNENRSFMQKIGSIFRRVFGMVRNSEHALAIFQAFDQGKLAVPSTAEKVIAAQLNKGAMALRLRRGLDGLSQGVAAAVLPAETILGQNQHSATARKLSGILFTNPGDEEAGGGRIGYLNAKRSEGKRWLNRANSIFEKMEKGDVDAVQKYMQAQTDPADIKMTVHRDAVIELRKTFEDFHTYMRDSGLKIGKVDKYYPTVWDVDALHKNKSAFIKMLVNKYAQQMNPDGGNAHKAAERIWSALIERNGVDNKAINATRGEDAKKAALREDGVLSPFFAGKEQQTLWWLDGADKEAYLSKNVTYTISQYFHQGVRAAEYQSRFGENGIKLEVMLGKIRKEITNASYELYPTVADDNTGKMHKVKLGSKMVDAQMPSDKKLKQGADREKWVGRQMRDISMAVGAIEGTLGKDISPNMRKFNSYMIAYQNIRLLPYMIFSSFVDPLAQVARGAPLNAAWDIFSYGMREVFRAWADMFRDMPKERQKDEWTKLAEHIGAIEVAMFNHHVAEDYSSVYMSPMARKINETLFKMNGMEAWDRANRTMATKWAVRFIEQHRGLPDKAHSQRWLTDLGLTPATIPVNADGQLITTAEELAVVKGITIEDAKQRIAPIHAALNRWVEGAVISPNAAQRPGWSSDPNYASVFHLKQFAYSFQQTIMKRALNELDHGNIRPISTLVAFVPTMLCADLIKGLIQGGGSLPPYMAGMDIGERIAYAAQRGGIFGTGDIGLNAIEDWSSLGGPAFEQIVDGVRDDFGRTAVNAMPLHSMGEYLFSGGKQGIAGPT